MTRWWRRQTLRALIAGSLAASALPAAATIMHSGTVPTLELAGQTVIHWRGATAVRIHSTVLAHLPNDGGVRLVSHGHYAFVRIDYPTACQHDVPHCATGMIDWTPAISDGLFGRGYAAHHGGPGTDIMVAIGDPQALVAGWTVLYLASDGESTLTLTTPDLHGRREVRLSKPAPIIVQRLSIDCGSPGACDTHTGYGGRLLFGGATHTVGSSGFATAIVINAEGSDQIYGPQNLPVIQPLGIDGCVYGPGMPVSQDASSPDHQTGCDVVAKSPGEADATEAGELGFTSVAPTGGRGFWRGDGHRQGATYVGYIIDDPLDVPPPKWREAWGIWLTYVG